MTRRSGGLGQTAMTLVMATLAMLVAGCAGQGSGSVVVAPASAAREADLLGRIKALEGEWLTKDPQSGQMVTASVFKASSGGSAVREVMFPGSGHEMTNMYHMDGDTLVVTHYCAVGNQPRMRARGMSGNEMRFEFDSVTNRTSADQTCMGNVTIVFVDGDHIVQKWRAGGGGKEHSMDIELERKK